jgi:RimJ/RimL family protein N-acetyltransferase
VTDPVLVPFKMEHLAHFEDRDKWGRGDWRVAYNKEIMGPSFSAVCGGRVIACAGIAIPWPGMGTCWATFGEEAAHHPVWLSRTCRRIINDTVRACGLHRIEAVSLRNNERNRRWLTMLGFRHEWGVAYMYTSDQQDVVRYERLSRGLRS